MSDPTWEDQLRELAQDLFDIMANEPIKLVIKGEYEAVEGTLYTRDPITHRWTMGACVGNSGTADACLIELVRLYKLQKSFEKAMSNEP